MGVYTQQIRQQFASLYEGGSSLKSISETLGVSYKTIRIWAKRYRSSGLSGLLPNYSACGRTQVYPQQMIDQAVSYKQDHPLWGAGFIRLKLEDDFPAQSLPSVRQLQNYFQQYQVQPKRDKQPKAPVDWAKSPFDRVQVDAKECLSTADGQACCYLNFTDEYTGSELNAFVFPL